MRVHAECYQCFISQAIRSSRLFYEDRQHLLRPAQEVVRILRDINVELPPPLISEDVYGTIRKSLGIEDPYKQIKRKYNDIALKYEDFAVSEIEQANDPLLYAIRLSLAGNIIDFGSQIGSFSLENTIDEVVKNPLDLTDFDLFEKDLQKADRVVLLADNAGEIVFDKILLKTIKELYPKKELFIIVRGGPIINDVSLEDALYVGIDKIAKVIDSGQLIPGFWPDFAKGECKTVYESADIVISKGQGNFETLSEFEDRRVYFLFLIKCSVVAHYLGLKKLSKIFIRNDERWARLRA
ncbi:damage-control phosphatase ARMT1 family protein [Hippea maritima]|uniref:Damage-control phosphatase ARMT1-like metal-binding domain-containing protein n=1 Tax=Hippea maritima (strain ATCC 700847 / DSM 10411 / MH2) TaxID=760142 RepID=F2LUU7_HIPMA|nr:ARMT1-like domain-containing protein [Hippea maritima]AEA33552.1 protein of unknown function DUF89 [Hippea maritima DSM 10411]